MTTQNQSNKATERDELLQAALDFIKTLTGLEPPPIEVAPPEVFAPFREFVDKVQAITAKKAQPSPYDTMQLYKDLQDLWAEANAVDSVIGRPEVLMRKITKMRDSVGQVVAAYLPMGVAPQQEAQHPGDTAVDQFADAIKQRLAEQRAAGMETLIYEAGNESVAQGTYSLFIVENAVSGDAIEIALNALRLHHRNLRPVLYLPERLVDLILKAPCGSSQVIYRGQPVYLKVGQYFEAMLKCQPPINESWR